MNDDPALERAYRRLLFAYPRRFRRDRGTEILTTLLDAAPTRPAPPDPRGRPSTCSSAASGPGSCRRPEPSTLTPRVAALLAGIGGAAGAGRLGWQASTTMPLAGRRRHRAGRLGRPARAPVNRPGDPSTRTACRHADLPGDEATRADSPRTGRESTARHRTATRDPVAVLTGARHGWPPPDGAPTSPRPAACSGPRRATRCASHGTARRPRRTVAAPGAKATGELHGERPRHAAPAGVTPSRSPAFSAWPVGGCSSPPGRCIPGRARLPGDARDDGPRPVLARARRHPLLLPAVAGVAGLASIDGWSPQDSLVAAAALRGAGFLAYAWWRWAWPAPRRRRPCRGGPGPAVPCPGPSTRWSGWSR